MLNREGLVQLFSGQLGTKPRPYLYGTLLEPSKIFCYKLELGFYNNGVCPVSFGHYKEDEVLALLAKGVEGLDLFSFQLSSHLAFLEKCVG